MLSCITVFHVKRNDKLSESEILSTVERLLKARLPAGWSAYVRDADRGHDGRLVVEGADGTQAVWAIETKRRVFPRDIPFLADGLSTPLLLAVSYAGPSTREALASAGISYCDTTGNLRIIATRPAIWLEDRGEQKDPWRPEGPLASLRGRSANRVVRALCDFRPPYKIGELASLAGTSAPTTSRVSELLEREAIIDRNNNGAITQVDWRRLLERWTQDYGLLKSNTVRTFLDPRGLSALPKKLEAMKGRFAFTGTFAVPPDARVAPSRAAALYVENIPEFASQLNLTPVETGANVLLIEPASDVVFERMVEQEGLPCVAVSQVAVDLLTAPGRGSSEAATLMTWMEKHEDAWRS